LDGQEEVETDPNVPPRSRLTKAAALATAIVTEAATAVFDSTAPSPETLSFFPTAYCPTYEAPFLGAHKPRVVPLLPWAGTVLFLLKHLSGISFLASLKALASHSPTPVAPQKLGGSKAGGAPASKETARKNVLLGITSSSLAAAQEFSSPQFSALYSVSFESVKALLAGPNTLITCTEPWTLEDAASTNLLLNPPLRSRGCQPAKSSSARALSNDGSVSGSEAKSLRGPLSLFTLWNLLEDFSSTSPDMLIRSWLHSVLVTQPSSSQLEIVRRELPPLPLSTAVAPDVSCPETEGKPSETFIPNKGTGEESQDFVSLNSHCLSATFLGTHSLHELILSHFIAECGIPGEFLWSLEGRRFLHLIVVVFTQALPALCVSRARLGIRLKYVLRDWEVVVEEASRLDGLYMSYLEARCNSDSTLSLEDKRHFHFLAYHAPMHRLLVWTTFWSTSFQRLWMSCAWGTELFSKAEWGAALTQEEAFENAAWSSGEFVARSRVLGEWCSQWARIKGSLGCGGVDFIKNVTTVSSNEWFLGDGGVYLNDSYHSPAHKGAPFPPASYGHSLIKFLRELNTPSPTLTPQTATEIKSVVKSGNGKNKEKSAKRGKGGAKGKEEEEWEMLSAEAQLNGWRRQEEETINSLKIYTHRVTAGSPIQQLARCRIFVLKASARILLIARCLGMWSGLEDEAVASTQQLSPLEDSDPTASASKTSSHSLAYPPIFRNPRITYTMRFRELHLIPTPQPISYDSFIRLTALPEFKTPDDRSQLIAALAKDALELLNQSITMLTRIQDACKGFGGSRIELQPHSPPLTLPMLSLDVGDAGEGSDGAFKPPVLVDPPAHSLNLLLSSRTSLHAKGLQRLCINNTLFVSHLAKIAASGNYEKLSRGLSVDVEVAKATGLLYFIHEEQGRHCP